MVWLRSEHDSRFRPSHHTLIHFQLWDPRKPDALRSYTHHFDFISDFLWLDDKKHLLCTRYFVSSDRCTHKC